MTTVLSTIPTTPTAPTAVAPEVTAPPDGGEGEASEGSEGTVTAGDVTQGAAKETPDEDPTDKHLELSRRFDAIAKREARARRMETDLQTRLAHVAEQEKTIAQLRAELESAMEDPVQYYIKKGKDPVEIAKRFAKAETEEEKRLRLLEEREAKREEEAKKADEQRREHQERQRRLQAQREFVSSISPDECPYLTSMHDAREVPRLVEELLSEPHDPADPDSVTELEWFIEQTGRRPTDSELRKALETRAKARAMRIIERHQAAGQKSAPQGDAEAQTTVAAPEPSADPPAPGPSSISNRHAAITSSGKKKSLSLEERRAQAKKELAAALEAEAASRRAT